MEIQVAYNQHSPHSRNSRSTTNLNRLSLAPLTSRLPIDDSEAYPEIPQRPRSPGPHVSYITDKSVPTTPGILSRSPSRVGLLKTLKTAIPKSKSSTHIHYKPNHALNHHHMKHKSGAMTPAPRGHRYGLSDDFGFGFLSAAERGDDDWLLRAGTAISTGARESKGQAWLVSRASSTSLTARDDEDEEEEQWELARERASRMGSRRGSADADDEFSPATTRSQRGSRYGSRVQSRRGSRVNLFTPSELREVEEREGYFDQGVYIAEPDFVDVDEEVNEEAQALQDEINIKRLAKTGTLGLGTWVERLMGWSLFAVEEDWDETDADNDDGDDERIDTEDTVNGEKSGEGWRLERWEDHITEPLPPPGPDEGGWQDAAWLLSIATKVLL
jgi:hypothetical protein